MATVRWCISDDNNSFKGLFSPVLKQAYFESALRVLRYVISSLSLDTAHKCFKLVDILCERHDFEAASVLDVSEAHERHAASKAAVLAVLHHFIDDILDSLVYFFNPVAHCESAVDNKAQLEDGAGIGGPPCLSQSDGRTVE